MKFLLQTVFKNKKHLKLVIFTIVMMLFMTVANALEIFAIGFITKKGPDGNGGFFDKVSHAFNQIIPLHDSPLYLAGFIVFVALFKAICLFSHRFLARLTAIKIQQDLRLQFFAHLQQMPMRFYQNHNMGSLSSRVVSDASMVAEAINATIINYIQTPIAVSLYLTICILTSWQLSLLIFLGFPLLLFPIWFLAKRVKRVSREIQKNQERFSSVLIDFIGGIQTVKVFAMEAFSFKKYEELNDRMAYLEKKSAQYDLSTRPIVHTIAMIFLATTLIVGLYVLNMNVSEVLIFCGMLYLFYEPIKKFAEENSHIQRGVSAAERMEEVLQMPVEKPKEEGNKIFHTLRDEIRFSNVWFRYQQEWILKGVSLSVKKGEMVALVGPTGSGKSTLVQLLPRLYDCEKGEITLDGVNIVLFNEKSLRESIAFVPQRPFLFIDTVKENIQFGRDFTQNEVVEAAIAAHAHEFIEKLPEQYQTLLAEGGKNLSGGQQQRLTIARALIKKSPILIMDEATSSLDALSEHYIKETIQALKGQMTQIIIAHRLSTIENADKIIYLEKGEKIAEGTRDELLASCPGFKLTWDLMRLTDSK